MNIALCFLPPVSLCPCPRCGEARRRLLVPFVALGTASAQQAQGGKDDYGGSLAARSEGPSPNAPAKDREGLE